MATDLALTRGTGLPGPVVAIAGPTASGKSELAARIARSLGSPVISADAMQVYRGMDIGTAKVRGDGVRTLMIDVADLFDDYSVAIYQREARSAVDLCLGDGIVAVVCGGTGLYLDAVIDDLSFPAGGTKSAGRIRWETFAREHGAKALHDELERRDAAAAALVHPNNVRRVVRALELADGGVSYAEQNRGLHRRRAYYDARVFALTMDRTRLYERIDERVDAMVAAGLVDEVADLAKRGLASSAIASQAIGYKEMLDYLNGTLELVDAIALVKTRTRRYAKRQLSWLRRRSDVTWLDLDVISMDVAAATVLDSVARDVVVAPAGGANGGGKA